MSKWRLPIGVTLGVVCLTAVPLNAQVFTPTYMSPVHLNDIGVYVSEGPGDLALEGLWRGGPLGLRVGFVDGNNGSLVSVGGEIRSPIPMPGAPVGLAFAAGAQALVGDGSALGGQLGLTAGHRFVMPGLAVTPYIHPRIAIIDDARPGRDFNSQALADVGVDLEIPQNLIFRLGLGLSNETADWGIGIAWRR